MLFPPIISSPDQAMDVEDEEPEKEESQEEDSKFKALSCIDQVSSLASVFLSGLNFTCMVFLPVHLLHCVSNTNNEYPR